MAASPGETTLHTGLTEHKAYESLFCPRCGTLLDLPETGMAGTCRLCGFERSISEFEGMEVVVRSDLQDFARRFNTASVVRSGGPGAADAGSKQRQLATVDEECPSCGQIGLEYYTLQLRSADEGQTVFYECSKCGHKFSQNT